MVRAKWIGLVDKIVIEGGFPLAGEVTISGAKNAALPILASALLTTGINTFRNVPRLNDINTMLKLLRQLGCEAGEPNPIITLAPPKEGNTTPVAPYNLVKTMRASVLVLGPLLARFGRARVSLPGGCAIGARPIDQHLKGLKAMGARVDLSHGYVEASAPKLHGANIVFDVPTVTGTENLMMAAALAKGRTVLENTAREPEVEELAIVLNKMGASIQGAGTSVIQIDGVDELHAIDHSIVPDRIEAGTFLVAGAITGGNLLLKNARPEHLDAITSKLRTSGVSVSVEQGGVRVIGTTELQPVDITTQPYPGFPTDMQAQFMTLAACAKGQSVLKELIFENRFMHVPELVRMGAKIHVSDRIAVIRGVSHLSAATVMATDLRASACLVLAGLIATGSTDILRVYHLDRGYENIEDKLCQLGARIRRTKA